MKSTISIILIILLATLLRLWQLGNLPYGIHNDETLNGYVGRFILETGRDPYGNPWPLLYVDHFGDFPNVIPMYLSGIFTYIFGVNPFGVRFPIAVVGILTVPLIYLISKILFRSIKVAFMAAFLLTILPWHLVLSRGTAEGILASFVFLLGFLALVLGLERGKFLLLLGSVCLFLSTYLLYPGFRVMIPLVLIPTFLLTTVKRYKIFLVVACLVAFSITTIISTTVWGKGRYLETSVFTFNDLIALRSWEYSSSIGPNKVLDARIFHNKYLLAGQEVMRQYFSYFSPGFLAGTDGLPGRYHVPENGVTNWSIILIFVSLAVICCFPARRPVAAMAFFKIGKQKYFWWLLWILAMAPIPAALTINEVPNVHRTILVGVVLMILAAAAWQRLAAYNRFGLWLSRLLAALLIIESILFWHHYAKVSPKVTAKFRTYNNLVVGRFLAEHHRNYPLIYVTQGGDNALYFLFETKNFDKSLAGQFHGKLAVDQVDNIHFLHSDCYDPDRQDLPDRPDFILIQPEKCKLNGTGLVIGETIYIPEMLGYNYYVLRPDPLGFPLLKVNY